MELADISDAFARELLETERLARAGIPIVPSPQKLAELVRFQRHMCGWKKQALAAVAGVSVSTVERVERGERVRSQSLDRVAVALGHAPGAFTLPRVPLTLEQVCGMFEERNRELGDVKPVSVKPLRTQPQVAAISSTHMYLIDEGRLSGDHIDAIAGLAEWIDLVAFIRTEEEKGSIFRSNHREPAKRRQLYTHVLDTVHDIERRTSSVALAGTYQAETGAPILPLVEVAVIGFFSRARDPGAIKRRTLLAPAKVNLGEAWQRFCSFDSIGEEVASRRSAPPT